MKRKTIKAVLAKKHADFVASIEDEAVRKLVDKNSIITGGSIVSMLLGEQVNDFDYYFTDKETVLAVANYYVKKFNERTQKSVCVKEDEDGRVKIWIQSEGIAQDDSATSEELAELTDGEQQTTEFDDSGMEELGLSELKEAQSEDVKTPYRPIFLSANAISLTNKVQLVLRFYGEAEEIHKNYDFVHATCYWKSNNRELHLPAEALEAILSKELIYIGSKYPLCSIFRTKKFILRGWQINAGQYLKMCLQVNELNLKDINVLQDQLTGMDSAYFFQVISYLENRMKEEPEFKLSNSYLFEVINRIFN